MKILIAIKTCHRYAARAQAQRETWIPRLAAAIPSGWTVDLRFVVGRPPAGAPPGPLGPDVTRLEAEDGYYELPGKMRALFQWAQERGYDHVFTCDDDVYLVPERLLASDFAAHDYSGRLRGPSGAFPAPYASGFAMWLSRGAVEILAAAPIGAHRRDDRWIGNVLWEHGIHCHREPQFVIAQSARNVACAEAGARADNQVIAAGEYSPAEMQREHTAWLGGGEKGAVERASDLQQRSIHLHSLPFSQVAILISAFLRDGYLFQAIRDIEAHLPGAQIIIVDDGYESRAKIRKYCQLARRGHMCEWLPFNAPARARLAAAVPHLDREYTWLVEEDVDATAAADELQRLAGRWAARPELDAVGSVPGGGWLLRSAAVVSLALDPEVCTQMQIEILPERPPARAQASAVRRRPHHDWPRYHPQHPLLTSLFQDAACVGI
jgi:hypothetical protein